MARPVPTPSSQAGLRALRALLRERHPLAALRVFHAETGNIFRIRLGKFSPIILVGPQAARFVLVDAYEHFRWRNEYDPVTELLRHGVLVEDGPTHDNLRAIMMPPLHPKRFPGYVATLVQRTDQVSASWEDETVVDMLVEMRKVTLLNLLDAIYGVDFTEPMRVLWSSILTLIRYISPGLWMFWRGAPAPGVAAARQRVDGYLYELIRARRIAIQNGSVSSDDLLGQLIVAGLDDELIRDQLLTILIAGHDTNTALLAWSWYLLGTHPEAMRRAQQEVDEQLGDQVPDADQLAQLRYLGWVIREALRLYPPIHLGSRVAAEDLEFDGYHIPAGHRVIYSIYLTQRDATLWPDPDVFDPERHARGTQQVPFAWLAFGGGRRNCLGAAFGQLEARAVLARLLQTFELRLVHPAVHPHMGATLEPMPGVLMRVRRRKGTMLPR
jgi:cytochrome P450